jgi:hypothetical protein
MNAKHDACHPYRMSLGSGEYRNAGTAFAAARQKNPASINRLCDISGIPNQEYDVGPASHAPPTITMMAEKTGPMTAAQLVFIQTHSE